MFNASKYPEKFPRIPVSVSDVLNTLLRGSSVKLLFVFVCLWRDDMDLRSKFCLLCCGILLHSYSSFYECVSMVILFTLVQTFDTKIKLKI